MNIAYLLKPKDSVVWINKNNTLRQGIERMRANSFTAMPVLTEDGEYFGTVTEGDFLWYLLDNPENPDFEKINVGTIAQKDLNEPLSISAEMNRLIDRTLTQNFVPVVDDRNKFIGIVTRKAVINYLRSIN
jgi:CBS domain-containing protein